MLWVSSNFIGLKPHRRRFWIKLLPYPIISMISGMMYFIIERGIMGDTLFYPSTKNPYDPVSAFWAVWPMSVVLGLLIGLIEESSLFTTKLKNLPFFLKIMLKTALYVAVVLVLLLIVSFTVNSANMKLAPHDPIVIETITTFFFSFTLFSIVVYIGFMIGITLFFSEIIDYLGLDVVSSFFNGKYAKSVEEDRIFMFLDMKDSTAIAEKLGHKKHYRLINDYYADMTDAIITTKGSIYQYVGDEVIVFWSMKEGLEDHNCINCFYQIKERIEERSGRYQKKYGVAPEFKAAVHLGKVTRGQVGRIKKELLFTGDVLNTTARIQALCKELGANFLTSDELKKSLPPNGVVFIDKGSFELKGRNQSIRLHEVVRA